MSQALIIKSQFLVHFLLRFPDKLQFFGSFSLTFAVQILQTRQGKANEENSSTNLPAEEEMSRGGNWNSSNEQQKGNLHDNEKGKWNLSNEEKDMWNLQKDEKEKLNWTSNEKVKEKWNSPHKEKGNWNSSNEEKGKWSSSNEEKGRWNSPRKENLEWNSPNKDEETEEWDSLVQHMDRKTISLKVSVPHRPEEKKRKKLRREVKR